MPVTSRPSAITRPCAGHVQAGHQAHQRGLAGLRGARAARSPRAAPGSGPADSRWMAAPTRCSMPLSISSMQPPRHGHLPRPWPHHASAHRTKPRPVRAPQRCNAGRACCGATARRRRHAPTRAVQVAQLGLVQAGRHLGAQLASAQQPLDARAVGPRPAAAQGIRQLRVAQPEGLDEALEVGVRSLRAADPALAGRRRASGAPAVQAPPRRAPSGAASRSAASSASLRKVVILPPHTDSSRRLLGIELERIVARHRRRIARLVVEQRAHAGVGSRPRRPARRGARSSGSPARTGRRSRRRRCAPRRWRRRCSTSVVPISVNSPS